MDAIAHRDTSLPSVTAPLQIELRFEVELPPAATFDLLAVRLPEWFQSIHQVTYDNSASVRGPHEIGARSTRQCAIGRKTLVEEIVSYEPGRVYSYRVDMQRSSMKMPIRAHLGRFAIDGDGTRSTVTWQQYFHGPMWPLSTIIRWYMRERMMRPAIAVLHAKFGGRTIR